MGIDNSQAMLEKTKETLKNSPFPCEMIQADLNGNLSICNSSVIVMNYTLQFVRPSNRSTLLKNIYNALVPGGSLIVIEKVNSKIPGLNKTFIDFHHQFKKENGYSKLEISQKREALENLSLIHI